MGVLRFTYRILCPGPVRFEALPRKGTPGRYPSCIFVRCAVRLRRREAQHEISVTRSGARGARGGGALVRGGCRGGRRGSEREEAGKDGRPVEGRSRAGRRELAPRATASRQA